MSFRIRGLDPHQFRHLYGASEDALAACGVQRVTVAQFPAAPDRITLADVPVGERVLLLNFCHQPADTPYKASHAIFVREGAQDPFDRVGEVPEALAIRPISLRAFDARHFMHDATLVDGRDLGPAIEKFLSDSNVSYLHAHYAKRGCYAARIDRA
jgi:hypothetical protein